MAKGEVEKPPEWDEVDSPRRDASRGGRHFHQLSLRNLMIALVYFALVSWAGREVMGTNGVIHAVILASLIGLGVIGLGLWIALRSSRYAFLGWIVFVIGYMTVTSATISVFSIPSLPIVIGAIIFLTTRRRSTHQDALLWILRVEAERGMPLEPGVRALSSQVGGMFQVWTSSLADLLRQGVPLGDALESIPRVVTPAASFLIRMGMESGDLPRGLREATLARSGRSPLFQGIASRIAYLGWVALIAQSIVGFVLYFIVPKFEAIFKDFGIELPELTRFVISTSHTVIDFGWIVFLPLIGYLVYLPFALLSSSNPGVPLFDRLFPRKHSILLLRALALVVESGRPIVPAFHSMAEWYPTGWVRRKLHQARQYAEQGVEWSAALHSCGLLTRADLAVIESSARAGNLPWALRELAESGERRRAYRLQAWSQLLFVLMILGLGAMVFVLSVAFFMPLTTLIQRLAT